MRMVFHLYFYQSKCRVFTIEIMVFILTKYPQLHFNLMPLIILKKRTSVISKQNTITKDFINCIIKKIGT